MYVGCCGTDAAWWVLQMETGKELKGLEGQWMELLYKNIAIEKACAQLERQVAGLQQQLAAKQQQEEAAGAAAAAVAAEARPADGPQLANVSDCLPCADSLATRRLRRQLCIHRPCCGQPISQSGSRSVSQSRGPATSWRGPAAHCRKWVNRGEQGSQTLLPEELCCLGSPRQSLSCAAWVARDRA